MSACFVGNCSGFPLDGYSSQLYDPQRTSDCYVQYKETTLERDDFTVQLLMFVTVGKERQLFIIFFLSSICQLLSPQF